MAVTLAPLEGAAHQFGQEGPDRRVGQCVEGCVEKRVQESPRVHLHQEVEGQQADGIGVHERSTSPALDLESAQELVHRQGPLARAPAGRSAASEPSPQATTTPSLAPRPAPCPALAPDSWKDMGRAWVIFSSWSPR